MDDMNIWRTAQVLARTFGQAATAIATGRAKELNARGDSKGFAIWKRVAEATAELQGKPRKGDTFK